MAGNRFEQVDAPPDDAITLALKRDGEKMYGVVLCPATAAPGHQPRDYASDEMPLKDAFRSAVRLANDLKAPLVVVDPDGLWQAEWGTLYREED